MKKFLFLFIFIFSISLYSVTFDKYDVENINNIKMIENKISYPFYIPANNELSDGNKIYPIIKKVSKKMDANIYRACLKINKKGDYEEVKYVLINNFETDFFDSMNIDTKFPFSSLKDDLFYSTNKTNDKKQIGLIKDFGLNDNVSIYNFNKLYKNYPVTGIYSVELKNNKDFDRFIYLLCDEINKSFETKLSIEDFNIKNSDNQNEIVLETENTMLKVFMYIVLFITIILISFIIFYSSKKISILKLNGIGNFKIWYELFQKNITISYFTSTLFLIVLSVIQKLSNKFIIDMVKIQIISFVVLSIVLYIPYIIILTKNINLSLKNKINTKPLVIVNYIIKVILVIGLTSNSISIINNLHDLNNKIESLKYWEKSKNYGVIYPVLVGDDDIANPKSEINAVEDLYKLLNKRGSLFINARSYEDEIKKSNFEEVYDTIKVNPNYLKEFPIYDINNKKINISEGENNWILLVPERYKNQIDSIIKYIKVCRKASYEYESSQFTKNKYNDLFSQEIDIIWIKDNQEVFSFNSNVKKDNNNLIKGEILEVITEKNSYPIDKYGILGGGNRDPIKIKLEDYNVEKTYNTLLPYFNKWKISDNYTTIVNCNELVLKQIKNIKLDINILIIKFIIIFAIFLIIIIQNAILLFNYLKKKIIIRKSFGLNFYNIYREILIILSSIWIVQIIVSYLIFSNLNLMINSILFIFFTIELICIYIYISLLEKKNIIKVLKGE